jgi:hypothetical protein
MARYVLTAGKHTEAVEKDGKLQTVKYVQGDTITLTAKQAEGALFKGRVRPADQAPDTDDADKLKEQLAKADSKAKSAEAQVEELKKQLAAAKSADHGKK